MLNRCLLMFLQILFPMLYLEEFPMRIKYIPTSKDQKRRNYYFYAYKKEHFTFNDDIYQQCDAIAMGSPFGPVIAWIFMV